MFKLNFKAKAVAATKNSKDNYYMIGLADDKYDYKNYIIFQRPIKLKKDDDENADINGLYEGGTAATGRKFSARVMNLYYFKGDARL